MRIINQNGCVDLPYEQTVFVKDEGSIVARLPDGNQILMAQYSDSERASQAMQKMRNACISIKDYDPISQTLWKPSEYFIFPPEEDL